MVDSAGKLRYFYIDDQAIITESSNEISVTKAFPNHQGTKCVLIDISGNGMFFNPIDDTTMMIPNFSPNTHTVLWDIDNKNLFVTVDKDKM